MNIFEKIKSFFVTRKEEEKDNSCCGKEIPCCKSVADVVETVKVAKEAEKVIKPKAKKKVEPKVVAEEVASDTTTEKKKTTRRRRKPKPKTNND